MHNIFSEKLPAHNKTNYIFILNIQADEQSIATHELKRFTNSFLNEMLFSLHFSLTKYVTKN